MTGRQCHISVVIIFWPDFYMRRCNVCFYYSRYGQCEVRVNQVLHQCINTRISTLLLQTAARTRQIFLSLWSKNVIFGVDTQGQNKQLVLRSCFVLNPHIRCADTWGYQLICALEQLPQLHGIKLEFVAGRLCHISVVIIFNQISCCGDAKFAFITLDMANLRFAKII